MRPIHILTLASALALPLVISLPATAQTTAPATAASTASSDMAEGEIRKVSKDTGKLTIKHGPIKNLDMPPMTMVFVAKDPAMLEKVAVGDKVRFAVVEEGGKMVITELEPAK